MKTAFHLAAVSVLLCVIGSTRAAEDPARPIAATNLAHLSPPYPGCVKIFNGGEADPSTWSITNSAMRGVGGTSRLAYTKKDYRSFRLIFTARMNPVNR